ncbi:hypothetical protein ACFWP3_23640 [Streptomyces sp. NPDC058525]|uniref:hypothetical protein n=1 Tax=Streptomyces sp. NPDC058525 TaxID=3346538 RepID=UPI00364B7947
MSWFVPAPPSSTGVFTPEHPSHTRLRGVSGRLRRRLLTVNASVTLCVLLLAHTLGGHTASALLGSYTLGMLLLTVQAATLLTSCVWYDRACGTLCDPHVKALRDAAYGTGAGQRP